MILGCFGERLPATIAQFLRETPRIVGDNAPPADILRAAWGGSALSADDTLARDDSGSWLAFCGNPHWTDLNSIKDVPDRAAQLLERLGREGLAALKHLDGGFAIAWWHAPASRFTLIRDRFGVEPLHMLQRKGGVLLFGSRARDVAEAAAQAFNEAPRLSWQGLAEFLTYCYLPGNGTLFDGIERVPPGAVVEMSPGGAPQVSHWYRLSFENPWPADETAIAMRYRELLEKSVVSRLHGGRMGVFLSGGMDSSSVATFARRHLVGPIHSFSFRCGGNSFDESDYARRLAVELDTQHTEVEYGEHESLTIVDAVRAMDTPFCDIGIEIGTWLLARAAGGQVDYLQTGDGGDEIWASHPVYAAQRIMKWYDRMPVPRVLRKALVRGLDLVKDSDQKRNLAVVLKRIIPPPDVPRALGHFRWRLYQTPHSLNRLLTPMAAAQMQGVDPYRPVLQSFEGYRGPDDGMSMWLYSDYLTASGFYFSRLLLAREFGLEVRTPFYDRDLVEYGARIPAHLKLEGIERTKRLFRVAMEGVLPNIINHRKDKLGHSVPLKNWLRSPGDLNRLVLQTLKSESFLDRNLFNPDTVHRLVTEHAERRHNHSHRLWSLFVLEHWLRVTGIDTKGAMGHLKSVPAA